MTQPPDWAIAVPSSPGVHEQPAQTVQWEGLSQDQMRQLRQQLLESILAWVVQAVKGLFVPGDGFGSAFDQLEAWAAELMDVANLEELTGLDFSTPEAFLASLWEALEDLGTLIASFNTWITDLIFGTSTTAPTGAFPHSFPYEFGSGEPTQTDMFFYWVRKFTTLDEFDDLFNLNLTELVVQFIETLLKPQELLAELINGILPNSQAPQLIHDVMDAIIQGFAGNPLTAPFVPALQDVWDTISNLLGIGNDAQITGTDNSAEIAQIKAAMAAADAGGVSFIDGFDRIVSTSLGSDWTQIYSGAGAGYEGLDGTGYCHWSAAGGTQRVVLNICNTPLSSNTQYAAFVLRDPPYQWFSLQPVSRTLVLRSNAAGTNRVCFNIFPGGANFTIVVGGSVVQTVNATNLPAYKNGDLWELYAGSTAETYQYAAKVNGKTVLNHVDAGHLSQVGASNLFTGFGGVAGIHVLIFIAFQDSPPDVAAFSAADRTG